MDNEKISQLLKDQAEMIGSAKIALNQIIQLAKQDKLNSWNATVIAENTLKDMSTDYENIGK